MVEFAIIFPLLVVLVFGITELGRALFHWNTLTKAVTTGARYMARSNGNLLDPDNACDELKTGDGSWLKHEESAKNLIVYGSVAGGTEALMPNLDAAAITMSSDTGGYAGACVIKVEAVVQFDWIVSPLIPAFVESIDLTARTEERYIGE